MRTTHIQMTHLILGKQIITRIVWQVRSKHTATKKKNGEFNAVVI